jgi:hypothetical protein
MTPEIRVSLLIEGIQTVAESGNLPIFCIEFHEFGERFVPFVKVGAFTLLNDLSSQKVELVPCKKAIGQYPQAPLAREPMA